MWIEWLDRVCLEAKEINRYVCRMDGNYRFNNNT